MEAMAALLACPACNCHFRVGELECPHCGAPVARDANKLARAAGSLALGLIAMSVPVACANSVMVVGAGGAGGSTTQSQNQSTSHASTSHSTSHAASTYGCGPTCNGGPGTTGAGCDSIGTCNDPGMMGDPTKGCLDCALAQGSDFTDEGACSAVALAAYGSDGKCAMGGQPGACAFVACGNMCFANDPMLVMQSSWDCFCTNTKVGSMFQCQPIAMQTDLSTCVGKLAADTAALNAESAYETCVYEDTCPVSCSPGGG